MATTSIGAPGVTFPDATVQATAGATGVPVLTVNAASGSYTKPASLKAIKVTVVGGGAGGGSAVHTLGTSSLGVAGGGGGGGGSSTRIYPAPSLPASAVPFTVGAAAASSSFGVAPLTVITATGGSAGASSPDANGAFQPVNIYNATGGAGGAGSGGTQNSNGNPGGYGIGFAAPPATSSAALSGAGGGSILGGGAVPVTARQTGNTSTVGSNGNAAGSGGAGSIRIAGPGVAFVGTTPGSSGAAGVVIIEEFY